MNRLRHAAIALWAVACLPVFSAAAGGPRETRRFDADWRFVRGDVAGAQGAAFDDRQWRPLDLPHDWSIEDLPPVAEAPGKSRVVSGPFDSEAPGGLHSGFTIGGTG